MSIRGSHVNVQSLSHRYGARRPIVLDDITLTIQPGSSVALIGRSGCGKSTLLQLLSGMILPSSGQIHIDGTLVKAPSRRWNMMFQKPSLYPWMNAEKNAALGMLIAGEAELAKRRIPELLELVGMAEFAKSNVRKLSGGQQQRIALARSLATSPELLMLDEPFAALDEVTRAAMQRDVTSISKQLGITQVIVTHDIDEAFTMAKRVIVLSSSPGRVVADLQTSDKEEARLKTHVRDLLNGSPVTGDEESKSPTTLMPTDRLAIEPKREISLLNQSQPRLRYVV